MSHFCRQCRTEHRERTHPRFIRSTRDRAIVLSAGFEVTTHGEHAIVWVPRLSCDCQWKARVRGVETTLLELLLPDPVVYAEIPRRDAARPRLTTDRGPGGLSVSLQDLMKKSYTVGV